MALNPGRFCSPPPPPPGDMWPNRQTFCLTQMGEKVLSASGRRRPGVLLGIPPSPGTPHHKERAHLKGQKYKTQRAWTSWFLQLENGYNNNTHEKSAPRLTQGRCSIHINSLLFLTLTPQNQDFPVPPRSVVNQQKLKFSVRMQTDGFVWRSAVGWSLTVANQLTEQPAIQCKPGKEHPTSRVT